MVIRQPAWTPCGKDLTGASSVDEALTMAGVNFEVEKQKIYLNKGGMKVINNQFANVRSDNGEVLGIVSDKYKIVQNADAFAFANNLVAEGVEFEKGGAFHFGRAVWVQAKLPTQYKILGDDVDAHVVFVNSHDGKGSVKASIVPNRIVCSNQLVATFKLAKSRWSIKHSSRLNERLEEAHQTLIMTDEYMNYLSVEAERLVGIKITDSQFADILAKIYPTDTEMSKRQIMNAIETRNSIYNCLKESDLDNFRGTAYEKYMAVSDYFSHRTPQRLTKNFEENRWENIIEGVPQMDKIYGLLTA